MSSSETLGQSVDSGEIQDGLGGGSNMEKTGDYCRLAKGYK